MPGHAGLSTGTGQRYHERCFEARGVPSQAHTPSDLFERLGFLLYAIPNSFRCHARSLELKERIRL